MGCGCGRKSATTSSYVVVLPSGRQKAYSTEQGAKSEVSRVPGAYLKVATPTSA